MVWVAPLSVMVAEGSDLRRRITLRIAIPVRRWTSRETARAVREFALLGSAGSVLEAGQVG